MATEKGKNDGHVECKKCAESYKALLELHAKYELEKNKHKETEIRLKHALEEAGTDSLTRLLNRGSFREAASHVFALCMRDKTPVTMLYIDLNDFKKINDTYGHRVGDDVLREIAALLKGQFRESDILGRTGGDEFVALLPETDLNHANNVVEKINYAFEVYAFHVDKEKLFLSVSIGVVEASSEITSLEEIIEKADTEMYNIKRNRKKDFV